jgi:hypothetical protein
MGAVCAVGELHRVAAFDDEERKCACGLVPAACDFWSRIRDRFIEQRGTEGWEEFIGSIPRCYTFAQSFKIVLGATSRAPLAAYAAGFPVLYGAIGQTSGENTIVDSSRNPFAALLLLRQDPGSKAILLVRNGEDSLHSKLHRMESGRGFRWYRFFWKSPRLRAPYLLLYGMSWVLGNLIAEMIRKAYPERVLRVRYEDLGENPGEALERIGSFLGLDASGVIASIEDGKPIPVGHAIGGNILREKGEFVFQPDSRKPLPGRYRFPFRLFAWPMMWAYGYFGKSVPSHAADRGG